MLRAEVVMPGWELQEPGDEPQNDAETIGGPQWETQRGQKVNKRQRVASPSRPRGAVLVKQAIENNTRERNRVRTLREAFLSLQSVLPSVPPDTKLSKLDVLVLATSYIAHLTQTLDQDGSFGDSASSARCPRYLHPIKKWPMRARLYAEAIESSGHTLSTD